MRRIVTVKKAMYEDTTIRVKVNGREGFIVRVGVHQGSVLSPLLFVLFVIVLKALSIEKSEKACSWNYLMLIIMFCLQKQRLCCCKIEQMEEGY
jgi:hypothetical protein